MLLDFEKYAMKGNEFVNKLMSNLDTTDRAHASRILRSTFRVLRNHLTIEESLQMVAQLPMAIKAIYVEGWRIVDYRKIRNASEFLAEIVKEEGNIAWRDFSSNEEIRDGVRAVFETMRSYVSAEEIDQALRTLPMEVQHMFERHAHNE